MASGEMSAQQYQRFLEGVLEAIEPAVWAESSTCVSTGGTSTTYRQARRSSLTGI